MDNEPKLKPIPLISSIEARRIACVYQSAAQLFDDMRVESEAASMRSRAKWWMAYATQLGQPGSWSA